MKKQDEFKRILDEYYVSPENYESIKAWVRHNILNGAGKGHTVAVYSSSAAMKYKNCWLVFDPYIEKFIISKAKQVSVSVENSVQLDLADYVIAAYGLPSFHGLKGKVLFGEDEISELINEVADDIHSWCSLLDGGTATP